MKEKLDSNMQPISKKVIGCMDNVYAIEGGVISRNTFILAMPALSRCAVETKLHGVFRKNEKHTSLQRINSQVGLFLFLCKFDPVCFVLYYISSAEEAIQNMHGTLIGKQAVRISWGKTLANRQLRRTLMWGMYALTLAYAGTSNNKAICQLLHFVVSDVSDDVRRTVVLSLGFVLYSEPEQVDINEVVLQSLMLNLRQKVSGTQKEQKLMKACASRARHKDVEDVRVTKEVRSQNYMPKVKYGYEYPYIYYNLQVKLQSGNELSGSGIQVNVQASQYVVDITTFSHVMHRIY
ncbi:26S proteasome non-ATPase regulatory subunit 1 homolog A [Tanacetum coccineum]